MKNKKVLAEKYWIKNSLAKNWKKLANNQYYLIIYKIKLNKTKN